MDPRREFVYVLRALRHDRLVSSFVVLTLALGIGANAAIFGVVDRLMLRGPEQVANPDRVFRGYWTEVQPDGKPDISGAFDYPAYLSLRRNSRAFDQVGGYAMGGPATLGRGESADRANVGYASGSLFSTLGVPALRGRTIVDADDTPSGEIPPAVISYGLWQRRYGGADSALGTHILIDDAAFAIVGVAPEGFTGADVGAVDVWLPLRILGERLAPTYATEWDGQWVFVVGRLRAGADARAAAGEATTIFRHAYAGVDPASAKATLSFAPLTRNPHGNWSTEASVSAWILGLSFVVLVIACANVMNLLLARAARRHRDTAVRIALGASPSDITAHALVEGGVLAAISGMAAAVVAALLSKSIWVWMLPNVVWPATTMVAQIAIAGTGATIVVATMIGLILAARMRAVDVATALKSGDRGVTGRSGVRQAMLTISQCTLSVVLLVVAGVFMKSLWAAERVDFGIDMDGTYVVAVNWPRMWRGTPPADVKREWDRRRSFLVQAADRLKGSAGIDDVSVAMGMPFRNSAAVPVRPMDRALTVTPGFRPEFYAVDPAYFTTVHTRIAHGRAFATADAAGAERVVIVGQSFADHFWPGGNALNQCLIIGADSLPCARVVGVAADVRQLYGKTRPSFYVPFEQTISFGTTLLVVRPRAHSSNLALHVRSALLSVDANVAYVDVQRLHDAIESQVRPWEMGSLLFGLMGVLALTVAGVGLFGVVAYDTAMRAREIGIRRALGAGPGRVLVLVVKMSVSPAAIGVVAGVVIASAATAYLRPLLFAAPANDPVVMAVAVAVLFTTALVAGAVPAVRVNRRPPADALRAD